MKDIQMFRNQLIDAWVQSGGHTSSSRALSLATVAPNLFMNTSLDSSPWTTNLVHFYSSVVYVPLSHCIMAKIITKVITFLEQNRNPRNFKITFSVQGEFPFIYIYIYILMTRQTVRQSFQSHNYLPFRLKQLNNFCFLTFTPTLFKQLRFIYLFMEFSC